METESGTVIGEYQHEPVALREVLGKTAPRPSDTVLDCTMGLGGHSYELGKLLGEGGMLIGIDQDDYAIGRASERLAGLEVPNLQLKGNFAQIDELLQRACVPGIDVALFDLGVSSPQLDDPSRGFSYRYDAPLDMRMNPGNNTLTAAEVINTYDEADLTRIIKTYGEERWASRIAQFIVRQRAKAPIATTFELVDVIKAAIPASARREGGHHPARRTFQAIRIEVNQELEVLKQGLDAAVRWLNPGGRICVITYHSLEDRIVKDMFRDLSTGCTCPPELPVCMCGHEPVIKLGERKPLVPSDDEIERNPRARSAKVRSAIKLA